MSNQCPRCQHNPEMSPDDSLEVNLRGLKVILSPRDRFCRTCRLKYFFCHQLELAKGCVTIIESWVKPAIKVDWGKYYEFGTRQRKEIIELLIDLDILTYGYAETYVVEVGGVNVGLKDEEGGHLHFLRREDAILWTYVNFQKAEHPIRILRVSEIIGNERWRQEAEKLLFAPDDDDN